MIKSVVITGCSGGGKSTLLEKLSRRGYATVEEPGRRIVTEELAGQGAALPWVDPVAFARRAMAMALEDQRLAERQAGWTFFDRGLIDAASALQAFTGEATLETLRDRHRYHQTVFLTPPWPEIYINDPERRHGFEEAVAEYERLIAAYPEIGYEIVILPKVDVAARADFLLSRLPA
ncbi:putative ATPase [Rhizobium sp. BK529]|uniref:AAA family ATPase n=1 Tax=unclassified Rhizobium TaxID=2613769 RepID=UPI001051CD6F|nr:MULTISPECIES: AAA family ATPase [unclassified Rhizobium]MBB3590945.1 putative ATPase [Rhizobium sp. BK529]TCS09101.1 putative ATPase [Rhizobium sp. BK418]